MATGGSFLHEEQFLCCICLDVFTEPVTIPCGHNFCKSCITQHWTVNDQHQCPMCKEHFGRRPDLRVNTFISEMVHQFRQLTNNTSSCSEKQTAETGGVSCDICTEVKLKALKSCLVCLTSYCQTHLEPHHRIPGLKRHALINPVENLEGRMCKRHGRLMGFFCKTDQTSVCQFCCEFDHSRHNVVSLEKMCDEKKVELRKIDQDIQQMIQERRAKIQGIRQSVKLSEDGANAKMGECHRVLKSVQKAVTQLIETIEEKQKTTKKQAEGFTQKLDEEISELMRRGAEVEQLSDTEDPFQLLQDFTSLNTPPPLKDWTEVRVHPLYEGMVEEAVAQLEEMLVKVERLCTDIELQEVQLFSVDVTLDPETAHPALLLSDDGKEVRCGDVERKVPDNPKRFTSSTAVLGLQGFSRGRFYCEVQVKNKTRWDLGVVRESVQRKRENTLCPQNGYWLIWLRNGNEYRALAGPSEPLYLSSRPQTVGVFVDYDEGRVCFYDADTADVIYSFTGCKFTGKLYLYLCPCPSDGRNNSVPLVISPVSH